jgi:hypothetical protein
MAESSVEVGLPSDKTQAKWQEWTKEGGPGMGKTADVKSGQLPEDLRKVEAGTCYFEGANGTTKVRMQLKFNPEVLQKEGIASDWMEKRISLYLQRFKNFAEGRPA